MRDVPGDGAWVHARVERGAAGTWARVGRAGPARSGAKRLV